MSEDVLQIRNLSAGYGDSHVLHNINLNLQMGEIVGILGPNGAGKTTLMRTICQQTKRGDEIKLFDKYIAPSTHPRSIFASGVRQVPQGRGTLTALTVKENLQLGAYVLSNKQLVKNAIDNWLEIFPNLKQRIDTPAGLLSGGEQQMLALARSLIARPRLLLLDEPSLGLSPKLAKQIFQLIKDLHSQYKFACLIVEQHMELTLGICSHLHVMRNGQIGESLTAKDFSSNASLANIYLGV